MQFGKYGIRLRLTMKRKKKPNLFKPLSATVPPAVRRRLEEIASREDRSLSQVVRIALDEFLQRTDAA